MWDYAREAVNSEFRDFEFKKIVEEGLQKYGNARVSPKIDWTPASILPYVFERPPMTAPLAEIESYFLTSHPVFVFKPYPDSLRVGFRKSINAIYGAVRRTDARSFRIDWYAGLPCAGRIL